MGLLLRQTARVEPGAAATRWLVAPRPAATTDDYPEGIGNPAWRLTLEKTVPAPPASSMWSGIMNVEPSPKARLPARRILSLSLPYLPTDRLHRRMLGKTWR
jgi:hypothetical protein